MEQPPPNEHRERPGERIPFTATSAHRRVRPARPLGTRVALWTLAVLAVLVVVFEFLRSPPSPPPAPAAAPPAATAPPPPKASPTPTTTPEEGFTGWMEEDPTPTPTPEPTLFPTFTPRPTPLPTRPPTLAECIRFSWWAEQNLAPLNQVRVSIEVVNGCRRDVGQMELWFEIAGWRDGAVVQVVRAHPLDELRRGTSTEVVVGLPGSMDWYDEITVEILPNGR